MKLITTFYLSILAFLGFSQDQLFKKDNTKLEVKILEINQTEIKYTLFNYQNGPVNVLAKSDVALIIYQNGSHDVFNEPNNTPENSNLVLKPIEGKIEDLTSLVAKKNLISINILEPLNGCFGISYLREFYNNRMNIYIPISIGYTYPNLNQSFKNNYYNQTLNNVSNFTFTKKVIDIAFGLNFHTSDNKKITHFIGPLFGVSQFNGTYLERIEIQSSTPVFVEHSFILNRNYYMINNGFLFRINKDFNVLLNMALGVKTEYYISNNPNKYSTNSGYYNNNPFTSGSFNCGLHFGYKF